MTMALSGEQREALDHCYIEPFPVVEIGADAGWWQLFFELRDKGLVDFDDDSEAITITDAGAEVFAHDEDEDEDGPDWPRDRDQYTQDDPNYTDGVDHFYDGPHHVDSLPAADRNWYFSMITNGHLEGPDEAGYIHITDAGRSLLDDDED